MISICITTRNRPESLNNLLYSLLDSNSNLFELIIVDSSDDYETKNLIDTFISEKPFFQIIYSRKLCTLDEGYYTSASLASGSHIWFFSDDDLLLPFSISYIYEIINNKSIDLLIINSSLYSKDFAYCLDFFRIKIPANEIGYAINSNDVDALFERVVGIMGYISCILISRTLFLNFTYNNIVVEDNYFKHLHYVFSTGTNGGAGINWSINKHPVFITRVDGKSWIKKYLFIWGYNFNNTCLNLTDISTKIITKLKINCYNCSSRFLLAAIYHDRGLDDFPVYLKKAGCIKLFLIPWIFFRYFRKIKSYLK